MYTQQRERFLEALAREDAAALVATGEAPLRNGDSEYRFRPHSDFWYLTGFREPGAVLVLVPHRQEGRSILFLRDKNPAEEVWTGRRLGVEAAPGALGVAEARPLETLWDELPGLLAGHTRLVHQTGFEEERDREVLHMLDALRAKTKRGDVLPTELADPGPTLHELRLRKSADELECMRRAAALAVEAHLAVMRAARPGVNECELDALLEYTFRKGGSTGAAYGNIVAGGENACILHYVTNDQPLADGDLLLVDAGAEWEYYASDVTRTFPVNGRFSDTQRALYEVVLAAQRAGIATIRPGANAPEVHRAALEVLVDGLLDLGLLEGDRAAVIEEGAYQRFFMHKTGHWLGLDVHDCGAYFDSGEPRPFEPGMVQTVEPGLYVAPDDETVDERWRGIGIRIEDDVVVTESGHEVLTAGVPTAIDEVEAVCAEGVLAAIG
jgi:Xaa-Pro aminopeptidase